MADLNLLITDKQDEVDSKTKEINDLKNQLSKISLKSSANSLSDELQQVRRFTCLQCSQLFADDGELKDHTETSHAGKTMLKVSLLKKLTDLEHKVWEQKIECTSSLYELEKLEIREQQSCHCKNFCRITHAKHNFVKSKSNQLFSKLSSIGVCELDHIFSNPKKSNNTECDFGALAKKYTCNKCEAFFSRQSLLKKHKKHEHKTRERENGEVMDSVETGEMS